MSETSRDPSISSLSVNLRALAPQLISYQCELSALIEAIDADKRCADALIRFANNRKQDIDAEIESVRHAVIFLGLIDVKQFLFAFLLLATGAVERRQLVKLLARARMTSVLFATIGPLNKDLAFVATLLTSKKLLRIADVDGVCQLFEMNLDQTRAIKNLSFGLRETLKQTLLIEAKADPRSEGKSFLPPEHRTLYDDALFWSGSVLSAIR